MANVPVRVIVENLTPEQGSILSPVWVGFHDGGFDTYDRGRPASPGIQSVAEDGDATTLSQEFQLSGLGTVDGTVGGGPIFPGQMANQRFVLDSDDPQSSYFNYASMVIPSNDAWIGNGNEKEYLVFDNEGQFQPISFVVTGDRVLDAGSERNNELSNTTAGIGQETPNTGPNENGVVLPHPGHRGSEGNPGQTPGILEGDFGDFTVEGYQVARISIVEEERGNGQGNQIRGTQRVDWIDGRGGNDNINGRGGNDFLKGGGGNDTLTGGGGEDNLDGGSGNDTINGGRGMDILLGGGGRDVLNGGGSSDTLTGGSANDTFVISQNGGSDWILDYTDGRDKIGLLGNLSFEDLTIEQGTSDDAGSMESMENTLVKSGNRILAVLVDTSADVIDADDFMMM